MHVEHVLETQEVVKYLEERGLLVRYKKAKRYILLGLFGIAELKKRQPKSKGVWYFRISDKYRAYAYLHENTLFVFHIDDHQ